mmetsp:Transcript_31554/g.65018  ORF Transcript_31554/g.65018 Transcript_31554/m.65018 type:complete len:522 (-) Transcript_31554:92-1657(-)
MTEPLETLTTTATSSLTTTLTSLLVKSTTLLTGLTTLLACLLYNYQNSLLYFPTIGGLPRRTSDNPKNYRSPAEYGIPFETHWIPCEDGVKIHSWLLLHREGSDNDNDNDNEKFSKKIPTILFFHGNAGNIGIRLPNAMQMYRHLRPANIWLIDYRGYGDSDDAKVDERGLKLDAEAVLRYIHGPRGTGGSKNHLPHVDRNRIFVFGRSLGGAVAFHMAHYDRVRSPKLNKIPSQSKHDDDRNNKLDSKHDYPRPPLAGMIVENSFLSISTMVDYLLPYVAPFKSLVLRINWDSAKVASQINEIPALFLAGKKDTLVPHEHMLGLFQIMKESRGMSNNNNGSEDRSLDRGGRILKMHVVKDGTHNETWMQGGRDYWTAFKTFLTEALVVVEERESNMENEYEGGGDAIGNKHSGDIGISGRREGNDKNGPIQRKQISASAAATSTTDAASAIPLEVSLGYDGEASTPSSSFSVAAGMIPSVENFMGMAREATRTVVQRSRSGISGSGSVSGGGEDAYKKSE